MQEKQRQRRILDDANPLEKLIWFLQGMVHIVRALFPRRRIWRVIRVLRHPLIIGMELMALAWLMRSGYVPAGYVGAGGIAGAALALNFLVEL